VKKLKKVKKSLKSLKKVFSTFPNVSHRMLIQVCRATRQ